MQNCGTRSPVPQAYFKTLRIPGFVVTKVCAIFNGLKLNFFQLLSNIIQKKEPEGSD
jgi:hypothetical protein